MSKRRIDTLLVEAGLAESQAAAGALVMAGQVAANGNLVGKPGMLVAEEALLTLIPGPPFVGRGGLKLEHALDAFRVDVTGKVVIDVGASTGGFTDCLLKRGASRVYAVDVGKGQLDWQLRRDARVVVMEGVNARHPLALPEKAHLATVDVSFISVEKIVPPTAEMLKDEGYLVVLLKPQFEALRREVGRGGVVTDPDVHARVLGRFIRWSGENGFRLGGIVASPITGAAGNREFFVLLRPLRLRPALT